MSKKVKVEGGFRTAAESGRGPAASRSSRVFVGSFNFDPRSARLNTEMGLVIDSPALAQAMADLLAREIPSRAYQVRLAGAGALQWLERRGGDEIVHDAEPGASIWRRSTICARASICADTRRRTPSRNTSARRSSCSAPWSSL